MGKFIDLILGGIFVLYYVVVNMLSSRKVAFSGAILAVGIVLILFHILNRKFNDNRCFVIFNKIFKTMICIGVIFFIGLEAMIVSYPKRSEENLDYIMVLGAGLNNGGELSLTLKDRLDAALQCINDFNNDGVIVVSGGQGEDEEISEAEAMQRYLVKQGIAEERIIKEDKSRNTYENFKFSKEKIELHSNKPIGESSIKIITTDFHVLRSSMLAKRNGYKDIKAYSSNTVSYLVPVYYSREALALVKSFVFDR